MNYGLFTFKFHLKKVKFRTSSRVIILFKGTQMPLDYYFSASKFINNFYLNVELKYEVIVPLNIFKLCAFLHSILIKAEKKQSFLYI